ncbi:hypothetical protein [Microtetraspora glauca]|uniref:Uncharacterized protein n=1 Tax=Microtetraspora glauca TaxID=1996 RepID=A0ABV3GIU2_MICGL
MNEVASWPVNAITATVPRAMALTAPKSMMHFFTVVNASGVRASPMCAVAIVMSPAFAMIFLLRVVVVAVLGSAWPSQYGLGRTGGWGQTHSWAGGRLRYSSVQLAYGTPNQRPAPRHDVHTATGLTSTKPALKKPPAKKSANPHPRRTG